MTRGWRVVLTILGAIIALNVATHILNSLTGGSPGGPTSSSYATGADGLAGYLSLLTNDGHPVDRVRTYPAHTTLPADTTAVVLDPGFVTSDDALALQRFVEGGGRLIIGGAEPAGWLDEFVHPAPDWSDKPALGAHLLAPVPELDGVKQLKSGGQGTWTATGAALPVYGTATRSLIAVASLGRGRVIMLADASILQNAYLASAGNARFALAVAGSPARRVTFFESYHGYGPSTGYGSIPQRWLVLFGGLILASFALMIARGRRLGPPETPSRELPPPRRAYVDSLAGILARARRPEEALQRVRGETRARVARRAGLAGDAAPEALEAAARRIGLPDAEIDAMLGRPGTGDAVLAAGRALAHAGGIERRRDE